MLLTKSEKDNNKRGEVSGGSALEGGQKMHQKIGETLVMSGLEQEFSAKLYTDESRSSPIKLTQMVDDDYFKNVD